MYFFGTFGAGLSFSCTVALPKEEGVVQVLANLALARPTLRSLMRTPLSAEPARKLFCKSVLSEFASKERCTQLLLIEHIRQSQKFDKPSCNVFVY